jgi:uncharacterized protein YndB with AHSA1/START domain
MTTAAAPTTTTQVYRVYIKATPQAIWDAITTPEWTRKYGYGSPTAYDLRPGGAFRGTPSEEMRAGAATMGFTLPDVLVDGEVIECDPPRKLVQTWRSLMDPATAAEGFTRLTYEISAGGPGVSQLTLTHDLTDAPHTAEMVRGLADVEQGGGGWAWILSDLKTLLETGTSFTK